MVKKLDCKLKTGLKSQTRHEKYNKDENLENYDSEVQLYAGVRSRPRLTKKNHLKLHARRKKFALQSGCFFKSSCVFISLIVFLDSICVFIVLVVFFELSCVF